MSFMRIGAILAVLLALGGLSVPAAAGIPVRPDGRGGEVPSLAPILKDITPAVVNIAVRGSAPIQQNPLLNDPFFRRFFGFPDQMPAERQFQSVGSGVIVDAATGTIITNHHVIERADEITVTLNDGRKLTAKLVGSDPDTDLAVIRVPDGKLKALPLADSTKLEVGDFVVAIGNPFGLGQTVTSGIVSALGRSGLGIEGYEDFIQTDASINPGNSGGALVSLQGELVGINTAIVGPSGGNVGIGFAIPANMVRNVLDQIVKVGEVKRGQLGIHIQDLTPELAQAFNIGSQRGAVVAKVTPGSPADKAGLKAGDVVTDLNGETVKGSANLRNRIGLMRIGETVTLGILRDGKPMTISATIGAPAKTSKSARAEAKEPATAGIIPGANLRPAPEGSTPTGGGIEVVDVERNSAAWNAGLRPADIILSANQKPVSTMAELKAAAEKSRGGLLLNVLRGDQALFILIR